MQWTAGNNTSKYEMVVPAGFGYYAHPEFFWLLICVGYYHFTYVVKLLETEN